MTSFDMRKITTMLYLLHVNPTALRVTWNNYLNMVEADLPSWQCRNQEMLTDKEVNKLIIHRGYIKREYW